MVEQRASMKTSITRRDFLKLAGAFPGGAAISSLLNPFSVSNFYQTGKENFLVLVYDAFSAHDISLYGYQRETTPNLKKLADRAIVYHNHYAGCNFTTSGTASLLTGTLPWTHRALAPKSLVAEDFTGKNIFGALGDYYRIAYTHNGWANILLQQASAEIDELVPWKSLFLQSYAEFVHTLFHADSDTASVGWTRNVNYRQEGYAYSLFLAQLYNVLQDYKVSELKGRFPRGLPSVGFADSGFLLEDATDWIANRLPNLPQPFIGYFHLMPPHGPYNTSLEFYRRFDQDSFRPAEKPEDVFTEAVPYKALQKRRTEYDEFILYVDREIGRFFDALERTGMSENTWVVLTSDHGEMFERGISAHSTDALYEPVVRIPLMIFEPGRRTGEDVYTPTSAADVLPTLTHLAGKQFPDWTEGKVLPPFDPSATDSERNIYVVRATRNDPRKPLSRASTMLVKGRYKLLNFFGFQDKGVEDFVRLYDLEADPEEMEDLSRGRKGVAGELLDELRAKIARVDEPYR